MHKKMKYIYLLIKHHRRTTDYINTYMKYKRDMKNTVNLQTRSLRQGQ